MASAGQGADKSRRGQQAPSGEVGGRILKRSPHPADGRDASDAPSDESLALAAQRGCRASFERLVERLHAPLWHYLRRTAPPEDAEDLVQETFVRAFRKLDRYRPTWRFSTWLFTIGRRLRINHQRHERSRLLVGQGAEVSAASTGRTSEPLWHLIETEERELLWSLARRVLSEPQWTALWLFYVERWAVSEIARVLKRSPASVKTAMCRARRRLLAELRRRDEPIDGVSAQVVEFGNV